MTNADKIRQMTDLELAMFINIDAPSCSELCKNHKEGCLYTCQHRHGFDVILEWLKQENNTIATPICCSQFVSKEEYDKLYESYMSLAEQLNIKLPNMIKEVEHILGRKLNLS